MKTPPELDVASTQLQNHRTRRPPSGRGKSAEPSQASSNVEAASTPCVRRCARTLLAQPDPRTTCKAGRECAPKAQRAATDFGAYIQTCEERLYRRIDRSTRRIHTRTRSFRLAHPARERTYLTVHGAAHHGAADSAAPPDCLDGCWFCRGLCGGQSRSNLRPSLLSATTLCSRRHSPATLIRK